MDIWMSNVIPLFKDEDRYAPVAGTGKLQDIMEMYTEFAEKQGVDISSQKFLYACSTIMTLMQIEVSGVR